MKPILKEKKGESGEIKRGWRRGRQDKNRGGESERGRQEGAGVREREGGEGERGEGGVYFTTSRFWL